MRSRSFGLFALILQGFWPFALSGQNPDPLAKTGTVLIAGRATPYLIRNLPVSSFPDLPQEIAASLTAMDCLIPQTYEAHRPENVIHASLKSPGSSDWAVLCAAHGQVSLLIFFAGSNANKPNILSAVAETSRLQPHDATGQLGFNWGIDPASPRRIHDAQAGMTRRPPMLDHDCLADSTLDRQTVYRLYRNGAWETVETE
jgi:hypothetical protein